MLEGLGREVTEETGLRVLEWAHKSYEVRAIAPGLGWRLRVEVHLAEHVEGELHVDDPDGIVEHAEWSDVPAVGDRMAATAPWVGEPLLAWLQDRGPEIGTFLYAVTGEDRESMTVERVERLP